MTRDERYMSLALAEARAAFDAGEIPVGAVVVDPAGRILGKGRNLSETLGDVTAHAEIIAITAAEQALGSKWLDACTMYVTLEPCLMCAGALAWARMGTLVWGADDPRAGFLSQTAPGRGLHPRTIVRRGVMAPECLDLLKIFFKQRRR